MGVTREEEIKARLVSSHVSPWVNRNGEAHSGRRVMRYKIVEKSSGEVTVYKETKKLVSLSGLPLMAASVLRGEYTEKKSWERLPVLFTCIEDARKYVQGLKEASKMDEIRREEIIDV